MVLLLLLIINHVDTNLSTASLFSTSSFVFQFRHLWPYSIVIYCLVSLVILLLHTYILLKLFCPSKTEIPRHEYTVSNNGSRSPTFCSQIFLGNTVHMISKIVAKCYLGSYSFKNTVIFYKCTYFQTVTIHTDSIWNFLFKCLMMVYSQNYRESILK